MPTEADHRLPRTVVPSRYRLRLAPDLDAARFDGEVAVDVEVVEEVDAVVVNAADLEIHDAALVAPDGERIGASITLDADRERAVFRLDRPVAPGAWTLEASFTGILNDELRGFYRSVYRDAEGNEKVVAATQFEATDARRAFPCWDEPDLKAVFEVTLVVDDHLLAVSNAPEVGREALGDGKVAVRFAPTMKMSTYLVAFVVGELVATDPVDVGGVPLRIVHQPGQEHLVDYALEVGAHALSYFTDYYGIPYPGQKLDMIAIPDFAWGAMENLGAITYRETALLVDRRVATQAELMRVADVIAHEIAHMWFGDLVTMKWWNGIWLNEAFATFAEMKCVDAYRPDWNRWLVFCAERARSMETDALATTRPIEFPVASPEEANEMFDVLTYQKGSSVLRMLERFLGEEVFRRGVALYLERHAYGNTETADLWAALAEASGLPVGEIMDGWIFQGGFPEIRVAEGSGGYEVAQRQFRYLEPGETRWQVPLLLRTDEGEATHLLVGDRERIEVGAGLVANAGGDGFYRVRYEGALGEELPRRLGALSPAERFTVVSDAWAFVLQGAPAAGYVRLIAGRHGEDEPDVWSRMIAGIAELDRIAADEDRPAIAGFVRDLVGPKAEVLGWEPTAGETDTTRRLRGLLLRTLGTLGAAEGTIARSREVLARAEADRSSVDAEVADAALGVVAYHGTMDDWRHFVERFQASKDPQEVVKYLRAAASVPEPDAADRTFRLCLSGEVRSQDAFWVLAVLLGHRSNGPMVWELMKAHWEEMLAAVPPTTARRIFDLLPNRSEPEVAADVEAWLADHPVPGGEKYLAQQLELMRVRVGLRSRERDRIAAIF